MADALCGSSNPLETFQKHTSVDRTLQRDRFAAHQPATQGFRSSPTPSARALDAEFEAFQSGYNLEGNIFGNDALTFDNAESSFSHELSVAQMPDWASDFQKLHIHDDRTNSLPMVQLREQAPSYYAHSVVRHEESTHQHSQWSLPPHNQHNNNSINYISSNGYCAFNDSYSSLDLAEQQQVTPEYHNYDELDNEALERAFEAANQEVQQLEKFEREVQAEHGPPKSAGSTEILQALRSRHKNIPKAQHKINIIAGKLVEKEIAQFERTDADELARTAGELLNNVKDDHSQKFKESNFLSLMRQLRDREVHIDGDAIVDDPTVDDACARSFELIRSQTAQPLHPGGEFYPDGRT